MLWLHQYAYMYMEWRDLWHHHDGGALKGDGGKGGVVGGRLGWRLIFFLLVQYSALDRR